MTNKLKEVLKVLSTLLYPKRCPFCRKIIENNEYACKECIDNMPQFSIIRGIHGGHRCVSSLPYVDNYKKALLAFKFRDKIRYSKQFAQIMLQEVNRSYEDMVFDCVTYVPMHEKDEKKRGYNQCELLSKELSALLKTPYIGTLEKIKRTKPQHKLPVSKRLKNLKGAFRIVDKNSVKGKTVLLIDDVITTGSTLNECVKVLEKAQPQIVCCITLFSAQNM